MTTGDDEIAALYRGPLGQFTAARNALAKARGADGAGIKKLEKPHAAAWAVNQLYWHRRETYEAVIAAADAMRAAHARMLSGRQADVPRAEAAHDAAIKAAVSDIRALADTAGEALSGATVEAVSETLRALPSDDTPGRLTRPLKPLGFSALMTLSSALGIGRPAAARTGPAGARRPASAKTLAAEKAAARKAAAERAARLATLRKAVALARKREGDAETAVAASRKVLAKAERDLAAARDRLVFLEKQRDDADEDTRARERTLRDATNLRAQAEQDLSAEGG